MSRKLFKKTFVLVLGLSLFLGTHFIQAADDDVPTYLVPCGHAADGSDACTLCHLFLGISNILKWGRNILIAAALVAIVIGGILYIISAGNSGMMEMGKNAVKQALWGVAIVLGAWVIVNTSLILVGAQLTDLGITNWYNFTFTCDTSSSATTSSSSGSTSTATGELSSDCADYESTFESASGGDSDLKCLLEGVAMAESGCNPSAQSSAGACGMMQLLPSTANMTCAALKANPEESIQKAAEVLKKYQSTINAYKTKYGYDIGLDDLIASYNAGSGDGVNSDGTKQPFALSSDCTSTPTPAWQCNINPGGFSETQSYVSKVVNYQNQCLAE